MTDKYLVEKDLYNRPPVTKGSAQWGYFWDADLMDYLLELRNAALRQWAERLLRDKSILILGAGLRDVKFCRSYSARLTAVNISESRIRDIKEFAPEVETICADITKLPQTRQYDVIFCDAILHHLVDDLDAMLASMARWLTPDGIVFIHTEPLRLNPLLIIGRRFFPSQFHTPNEQPLVLLKFRRQVAKHFTIVHQRCDFCLTMLYVVAIRVTRLNSLRWIKKMSFPVLRLLYAVDRLISFTPINELHWHFAMVLRKKQPLAPPASR